MISLLVFMLILGVLIIIHELGHFWAARNAGVRVEKFSIGFGTPLWTRKKSGTEYSLSLIPLGGYVKMAGDTRQEYKKRRYEYLSKPISQRAKIIFCGPLLNYILGLFCFWLIFFAGYPALTTRVGGVIDGFGAKEAGIKAGDRITAVDGTKVFLWEELQKVIQAKGRDARVAVTVFRADREYNFKVRIKQQEAGDIWGKKQSIGLLGVKPSGESVKKRYGLFSAGVIALSKTWELTRLTYSALWRMVSGQLSVRDSLTGPLGIFYITSQAASIGLIAVLQLVAVLSISLCIFNLLPIPVLDGGHLALLAVEKLRGKPLSLKAERIITNIGLTLIILLALFATYNDLVRLFGSRLAGLFTK